MIVIKIALLCLYLLVGGEGCLAFLLPPAEAGWLGRRALYARHDDGGDRSVATPPTSKTGKKSATKKPFTIGDLQKQLKENPAILEASSSTQKKKYRRTRRRVEQPKQNYLYKSQRLSLPAVQEDDDQSTPPRVDDDARVRAQREFGLMPDAQHADPLLDPNVEPVIAARVQVVEEGTGPSSFAYLIEKPAGWSVIGVGGGASTRETNNKQRDVNKPKGPKPPKKVRVKVREEDGSVDELEYNQMDVLALLTPEERAELLEGEEELTDTLPSWSEEDSDSHFFEAEEDMLPEPTTMAEATNQQPTRANPETEANLRRIAARQSAGSSATFQKVQRPSIVAWLKEQLQCRGGNYWTGVAGATEVDDSGLVLLCPRKQVDNVFVDSADYVAVVGNGGHLAPRPRQQLSSDAEVELEPMSKLRKGRGEDLVDIVKVRITGAASKTVHAVEACQVKFQNGIRGDAAASPLDRRARRRLVHCQSLAVSSLVEDETAQAETSALPDDMAILSNRRNHLEYKAGSFLGRSSSLRLNPLTNAYREIDGAADGFPGWTVDRYDQWLLVQHDPRMPKGPLPSIHDGNTAGVYYLESSKSTAPCVRPILLEGQAAPDLFPILENGVKYLVSFNDLSTGIFLDQRPQRAWLTRNCCPDTRVLNCFAHTGGFSVAAASAGAATVSLDLSRKWLDRLPLHLQANQIEFDDRHDCIYGDCFEWLTRLAKRGERYDIVILDPPSASVVSGKKKKNKRWSVKNDMDELVALASTLVRRDGGLLWTSTNSATLHPQRFARLCHKGFQSAQIPAKLEYVQPMPSDFQSIGPQPVKNLVWRVQ